MLITLTPGGTGKMKDYFSWRIDSEGSPTDSRGGPHHVWRSTLLRVVLSSIQDSSDASMIVGYILVINRHALPDAGQTVLLTRITV